MNPTSTKLQVLICTYGHDGIERIAANSYPEINGVEYLVCWQTNEINSPIPAILQSRPDFKIHKFNDRGLSVNRNHALSLVTAPVALISDDDVKYTAIGLQNVLRAFEDHSEADIITFTYASDEFPKTYPDFSFSLNNPPKGYFITSFEIGFRPTSLNRLKFNENFGIGARFMAGEEEIFIYDALKQGLTGVFIPLEIARHDGSTTCDRHENQSDYIATKGAIFTHIHPISWPLRMIAHAIRFKGSRFSYISAWTKGAIAAYRLHAFHK